MYDPTGAHKRSVGQYLHWIVQNLFANCSLPLFESRIPLRVHAICSYKLKRKTAHVPVSARKYPDIPSFDVDNVAKTLLDIGNGILWVDDRQIQSLTIEKKWSTADETEITIENLHEAAAQCLEGRELRPGGAP
jgi:Holliday junction resolvase RusA-like endonuclease